MEAGHRSVKEEHRVTQRWGFQAGLDTIFWRGGGTSLLREGKSHWR